MILIFKSIYGTKYQVQSRSEIYRNSSLLLTPGNPPPLVPKSAEYKGGFPGPRFGGLGFLTSESPKNSARFARQEKNRILFIFPLEIAMFWTSKTQNFRPPEAAEIFDGIEKKSGQI